MKKFIIFTLISAFLIIGSYIGISRYSNQQRVYENSLKVQQKAISDANQKIADIQKNNGQEIQTLIASQKKATDEVRQKMVDVQKKIDAETEAVQNKIASTQNTQNYDATYSSIVAEWQNRVAEVTCFWEYQDKTTLRMIGSATLFIPKAGVLTALTNNHVITDPDGNYPNACIVGVYGVGSRTVYNDVTNHTFTNFKNMGLDIGWIKLNNPYSANDNGLFDKYAAGKNVYLCDHGVNVGDKLIVLGYPYDGSQKGITITQGIVSGEDGNYYVTDAKIDHGNSGGAAILVKNGCSLGIPTASYVGQIESYARILKASVMP